VGEFYDVFLPMAYYTFRTSDPSGVRRFVAVNVAHIRARTGDPDTPVRPIGGIAGATTMREIKGFVRAVKDTPRARRQPVRLPAHLGARMEGPAPAHPDRWAQGSGEP
jgi:hypothetical protein